MTWHSTEPLIQHRTGPESFLVLFNLTKLDEALMSVSVKHVALATRYVNGDGSDIDRIMPMIDRFVRLAG
jgi:hypothetical protein